MRFAVACSEVLEEVLPEGTLETNLSVDCSGLSRAGR